MPAYELINQQPRTKIAITIQRLKFLVRPAVLSTGAAFTIQEFQENTKDVITSHKAQSRLTKDQSKVTDKGSRSIAETFDLSLIDLASVFSEAIMALPGLALLNTCHILDSPKQPPLG